MHLGMHTRIAIVTLLLSGFVQTGCVTSKKYRMAKEHMHPAVGLNYTTKISGLEAVLVTVIVYQGPGSWKQGALWDEYVVSLANRSAGPLTIESMALVDLLGEQQVPGTDPWKLEQLSETNWKKYGKVGQFVRGVGAFTGAVELSAIGYGLTGGALSGVFFVMPVVLIADVVTVGILNHRNKAMVQQEFNRRRLALPLTIAPGQSVAGSFFFPVVPSPQRLVLKSKAGNDSIELVLDLKPLSDLHLKPAGG